MSRGEIGPCRCRMSSQFEYAEFQLRAELEAAEEQLRNAPEHERAAARRLFLGALHRFTRLVMENKPPDEGSRRA